MVEKCGCVWYSDVREKCNYQLKLTVKPGQFFFATVLFTCEGMRHTAPDVRACLLTPIE